MSDETKSLTVAFKFVEMHKNECYISFEEIVRKSMFSTF